MKRYDERIRDARTKH